MQKITASTQADSLKEASVDRAIVQLPNLVLAGAPKCGTSSLFSWLTAHPEVCGSTPKEAFYFMDEAHPLSRSEANYHRHGFSNYQVFPQNSGATVFVEATTHYLYQATARDFFAACKPQPLVVFVLRQPSDRILSSFRYTQNNLARLDRQITFASYVELLLANRVDQIQEHFHSERSFFVLKRDLLYSQYADFLDGWAARFAGDRLKVILFEQLKANPQGVLSDLASDLGIDSRFYDRFDFQQKNQTVTIQSAWLHRTLRQLAPKLPKTRLKTLLKLLYFKAQQRQKPTENPDADRQALEQLDRYFEPYNRRLAEKFDLDSAVWQR